jgi:hypothetical protein
MARLLTAYWDGTDVSQHLFTHSENQSTQNNPFMLICPIERQNGDLIVSFTEIYDRVRCKTGSSYSSFRNDAE